ncbi:MAG: hypothetical protein ACI9J3_001509 [Parvicellaceae bacterium]|jgi:hypothetical protein
MGIKKICLSIQKVEAGKDVNRFTYKGMVLWPLVRYHLLRQWTEQEAYNEKHQDDFGVIVKGVKRSFWKFKRKRFLSKMRAQADGVEQVEVAFFTYEGKHTDEFEGKAYDKNIDPFYEKLVGRGNKVAKFQLGFVPEKKQKMHPSLNFNIDALKIFMFLDYSIQKQMFETEIASIVDKINKETGFKLNLKSFQREVYEIFAYREFFLPILQKLNPKVIFMANYYSPYNFALTSACKSLNIETVDIQHGKQGEYHPMNSHWTKVPSAGYELLPSYFWNWGEESVNNIKGWMPQNSGHRFVAGGNLWLAAFKNDQSRFVPESAFEFKKEIEKYERVVLFTLQPIGEKVLPDFVKKSIEQCPESWLWLVRVHPYMGDHMDKTISFFKNSPNVELAHSTDLPLYFLLDLVDHHVTCWSSVYIEALHFEVPTTIVSKIGEDLYQSKINAGKLFKARSASELMSNIENVRKIVGDNYILTNEHYIESAFNKILNQE